MSVIRACFLLITVLMVAGWTDEPPAWWRPDSRPINPVVFQRDRSFCRMQASGYFGREWAAVFTDCMVRIGYIPVSYDILP